MVNKPNWVPGIFLKLQGTLQHLSATSAYGGGLGKHWEPCLPKYTTKQVVESLEYLVSRTEKLVAGSESVRIALKFGNQPKLVPTEDFSFVESALPEEICSVRGFSVRSCEQNSENSTCYRSRF